MGGPEPRSVALRLRVRGVVQGVGFRYFTRRRARELGLVGRVRNLADGQVEIEVAGDVERVEQLKEAVRRGPDGAAVSGLDETELDGGVPAWDRFEIER
jgi:acylphosphatase